jgi:hypothetical protein
MTGARTHFDASMIPKNGVRRFGETEQGRRFTHGAHAMPPAKLVSDPG